MTRRWRRLTESASEGCVRAVTAEAEIVNPSIKNVTISLCLHVKFEPSHLKPGSLPIRSIHAQTPVLARLPLALVSVVFAPVSLETGRAGASEAAGVAVASAAVETWL